MAKKKIREVPSSSLADMTLDFQKPGTSIWMLIGLVGAGKTTLAKQLWATDPKRSVRSSLDEIIQMTSFYSYEPGMSGFYGGIEQSAIIEGLLDGYKVIIDRTNITRNTRAQFISLVKHIRRIAKDFLGLFSGLDERDFFEQGERDLIEQILLAGKKKDIAIHTAFLKLVRDWKKKMTQPSLFARDPVCIKKRLYGIVQIEIAGIYFDVPKKVCMQRRMTDPYNALRDTARKVDWRAVIGRMAKQLEPPHLDEGFDRLFRINEHGTVWQLS